MITLSSQRLVGQRLVGASQAVQTLTGDSQAGETRGERSKRVNHAIKHGNLAFAACTIRLKML
jgi:hypothetical protein